MNRQITHVFVKLTQLFSRVFFQSSTKTINSHVNVHNFSREQSHDVELSEREQHHFALIYHKPGAASVSKLKNGCCKYHRVHRVERSENPYIANEHFNTIHTKIGLKPIAR